MTLLPSPVAYPSAADPGPLLALASGLARVADGVGDGGETIELVGRQTESYWTGRAAEHFRSHLDERVRDLTRASAAIQDAVPALREFAAAVRSTEDAHRNATFWYQASAAVMPPLPPAAITGMYLAARDQQAAVDALEAAGRRCAQRLDRIRATLRGCDLGEGQRRGRRSIGGDLRRSGTAIAGDVAGTAGFTLGVVGDGMSGLQTGLLHGLATQSEHVTSSSGREFRRWKPDRAGGRVGFNTAQAARIARTLDRWGKRLPVVNLALTSAAQGLTDWERTDLTSAQRVTRVGSAVVLEGGLGTAGASLGAAGGAKAGAAIGAAVGVWFGGVGAVPGAVIGAAVGGIAGAIGGGYAGGKLGGWMKQKLFKLNPRGWFRS
ncbi:MAG: putative T7SS-secreted protein [Actinomycetota bacterium]